jgi:hypothetical protein
MPHKEWPDLELQDLVHLDLELDLRVDQIARVHVQAAPVHVQALQEQNQDLVAVHLVAASQREVLLVGAAEVSVEELLELSEKAEQEARARLESQSALNVKSLSKEVSRVWVAQLCRVGMEPR